MTINLWHCIIINFTSLALEGVHNRLSLFKVLTQSRGPIINNYHRLCKPRVETPQQYIMYIKTLKYTHYSPV